VEILIWLLVEFLYWGFAALWGSGRTPGSGDSLRVARIFEEACRAAGRKLGGSTEARASGDLAIRYRVRGRRVELLLDPPGRTGNVGAVATVELGGNLPGAFRIVRLDFMSRLAGLWTDHPLPSGDWEFDRRFTVRARPESPARSLFGVRWRGRVVQAVMALALRGHDPAVEFDGGRVTVRIEGLLLDEAEILEFARLATVLTEALLEGEETAGVVWCGESESAGECQVCGSAMAARVVRCAKCGTPHHRECWSYNGMCSTYACGSRSSR
jgi:hypothetical protein